MTLNKSYILFFSVFMSTFFLFLEYEQNYKQSSGYFFHIISVLIMVAINYVVNKSFFLSLYSDLLKCLVVYFIYLSSVFLFGSFDLHTSINAFIYMVIFCIHINIFGRNDLYTMFLQSSRILIFVFSIISVLIELNIGLMWDYSQVGRNSSLFHDPNYAAVIFSIGLYISYFFGKYKTPKDILVISSMIFSLFLCFSKSGILFSIIVFGSLMLVGSRKFLLLTVFLTVLLALNLDYFLYVLSETFPVLRIEHGLNGRDVFFELALQLIYQEPFVQRTSSMISYFIDVYTYRTNVSFHNTYLDIAFVYGLQFSILLIFYVIHKIYVGFKKRK